jgi:teichuronic acid biosynthesis glycosyltransferase TuaH
VVARRIRIAGRRPSRLAPVTGPGPLLVLVSGKPWDGVRGVDRHVAEQLTRYADVLWVDPPLSPVSRSRFRHGTDRLPRPRLTRAAPRIVRLSPVALPGLSRPGVRATTSALLRAQMRWALGRTPGRVVAVVACCLSDVLGRWGPDVVDVLYGTDDWMAGASLMRLDSGWLAAEELKALARADEVVAVTPALVDRWRGLGARPLLLPNGCEPDAYAEVDLTPPAPAAAGLPGPVAGLVGRMTARVDMALLEAVADAGLSLLLVGPHDPGWEPARWSALLARPRVVHVGEVPFDQLPGYLRVVDVGITPYALTDFNKSSFPLKTLEYLAAGRAAVSTPLPAARWLADAAGGADLVRIGEPGEFVELVLREARAPRTPALVARRRAFAAEHSWRRRADELARHIGLTSIPTNPLGAVTSGGTR